MLRLNFTPFPLLVTERLILRKAEITDHNETFLIRSDEKVNQYLDRPKPESVEDARKFLNKLIDGIDKNEWIAWVISLKSDPKLMGSICLWNISEEHSVAELGFELSPHHWGKGIVQEALLPVLEYGFGTMKLDKIEGWTHRENLRSHSLMERNNFTRDLEMENKMAGKDFFRDMVIYSLSNNRDI